MCVHGNTARATSEFAVAVDEVSARHKNLDSGLKSQDSNQAAIHLSLET